MADETGKRITFDSTTLERAQAAAKERGMTLNRLVGLAVDDFIGRLLPADEVVWTRIETTRAGAFEREIVDKAMTDFKRLTGHAWPTQPDPQNEA